MNKSGPIVSVVDDDEDIRESLSILFETMGLKVQTYGGAQHFLAAYDPAQAGCLVLDVRMPGMSGPELQSKLAAEGVGLPIIIITGYGDVPMAVDAVRMGAVNFIEKPFRDQVLLDSVQKAIELDAQARLEQCEQADIEAKLSLLTPREQQILDLLVTGKSSKMIAYELGISQKTVSFHRAHILEKVGVDSVLELARLSQKAELV
ncbi:MAG TPA: response regulator transcription factor [Phycisphaerales bacterium]|nr:response regulator transcription factor [Phycisphaerales bacterium]